MKSPGASRAEVVDRITLAVRGIETADWIGEIVLPNYDERNRSAGMRIALGPRGCGRELVDRDSSSLQVNSAAEPTDGAGGTAEGIVTAVAEVLHGACD